MADLDNPAEWVGRKVKIVDGIDGTIGERGVVLAVDDTAERPSAWVKVNPDKEYPSYRSCNLCWLEDIETGEDGPAWGTEFFKLTDPLDSATQP